MTQEKWNTYLHMVTSKVFTKRNAKIAVCAIIICGVGAAGGTWYHHQQKVAYKEKKIQAMSQMVAARAQASQLSLISEDKARSLAAQAIGKDESTLSFSRVALIDLDTHKEKGHEDKDRDKHEKKDKKDKGERGEKKADMRISKETPDSTAGASQNETAPAPQQPQDAQNTPATAPTAPPKVLAFHPVYQIRANDSDSIRYDILIDAVTGEVLTSHID